jgi:hypothetical protein
MIVGPMIGERQVDSRNLEWRRNMNMGGERTVLLVLIVVAIAGFGLILLRQTGTSTGSRSDTAEYAVRDIPPSTDLEDLPPILRNRAARGGSDPNRPVEVGAIQSPIELDVSLIDVNEIGEGGEAVVGVRVRPRIEAPDMRLSVRIPEGLSLQSGETSWEGRLAKDEEKKFQFVLSVPDGKRYELYTRAEIYLEGDVVTRGITLPIDLGSVEEGAHPPFERVGPDDRGVTTFKGRVEEGGE